MTRQRQESMPGGQWHGSSFTKPSLASRRISRRPKLRAARIRARANARSRASIAARKAAA